MREKSEAAEIDSWLRLGLDKLNRSPHVHHCLLCREIIKFCGAAEDDYLERARDIMVKHAKKVQAPERIGCRYSGCFHHETISRELALQMIELGGGDRPEHDLRRVSWTCIPFVVREQDHPPGFDMFKQDVVHRYFLYLPPAAGHVYIRLGPKQTVAHVCISPAYKSRHEHITDVPTLEDVVETFEKNVPAIREWAWKKYIGLKVLAEGELKLAAEDQQKEKQA